MLGVVDVPYVCYVSVLGVLGCWATCGVCVGFVLGVSFVNVLGVYVGCGSGVCARCSG